MIVRTQEELTAALANPRVSVIEIHSDDGVWLRVEGQRPGVSVEAWESSHVEAWGSSHVEAWESSSVVARESSRVVAWESSHVVARGSSHVEAWESSSVVARESSHVVARGSSHVEATPHVAIHLHSATAIIEGGVVIDVTDVDKTGASWCEHHGVKVTDGKATLYKAVNDQWTTPRGFVYEPGETVTAPDWRDTDECGYGLHLGPTPRHSRDYYDGATRFVAVEVTVADLRPISGPSTAKAKTRECVVLHEVDIDGKEVAR